MALRIFIPLVVNLGNNINNYYHNLYYHLKLSLTPQQQGLVVRLLMLMLLIVFVQKVGCCRLRGARLMGSQVVSRIC